MNFCRNVCTASLDKSPKLVGTQENPAQIDESYRGGRRKYNRCPLNKGDKIKATEFNNDSENQNSGKKVQAVMTQVVHGYLAHVNQ